MSHKHLILRVYNLQSVTAEIMDILEQLPIRDAEKVLKLVHCNLGEKFKLPKQYSFRLTKLERDVEVRDFLITLELENMTQKECLQHCVQRFGKSRSPSRTGLSRAWPLLLKQRINSDDK